MLQQPELLLLLLLLVLGSPVLHCCLQQGWTHCWELVS
jgi:hypothetical protein